MKKHIVIFFLCLVFRVFNALILHNTFTPDEHWQSSEVAHWLIFGYGFLTWEWEPCVALRDILHPSIIAAFYWMLKWFGLDSRWMVAYGPRVFLGSAVAAAIDVGTTKLAHLWFGPHIGFLTLAMTLAAWFNFFSVTRTYSNCLEAFSIVWGVYWWSKSHIVSQKTEQHPATKQKRHTHLFCISALMASLGVGIRPTAAVFWIFLYSSRMLLDIIKSFDVITISSVLIDGFLLLILLPIVPLISFLMDYKFYGNWQIPMLNFAAFNLLVDPGKFYGRRPWHFYLVECPLVVLLSYLPFLVLGIYYWVRQTIHLTPISEISDCSDSGNQEDDKLTNCTNDTKLTTRVRARKSQKLKTSAPAATIQSSTVLSINTNTLTSDIYSVLTTVVLNVILLSKATHKEYRFMLPFLPLLIPLIAQAFHLTLEWPFSLSVIPLQKEKVSRVRRLRTLLIAATFGVQVIASIAVTFAYLTGAERTMDHLSHHITELIRSGEVNTTTSVFFLTTCHQLPLYSFIHNPSVKMGFLDCSPQVRSMQPAINQEAVLPSWRHRLWDNPIHTLNLLFPIELQRNETMEFKGTTDVYINPSIQQSRREGWWFGGLPLRSEMVKTQLSQNSSMNTILQRRLSLSRLATCLDYRFNVNLKARNLPDFFVVPSILLQYNSTTNRSPMSVHQWLQMYGYVVIESIFDSIISEHPKEDETAEWTSRIFIYKRQFF